MVICCKVTTGARPGAGERVNWRYKHNNRLHQTHVMAPSQKEKKKNILK